jgi:lactate dehydrogenase-like 2-hydroxyacid dehydrogenase
VLTDTTADLAFALLLAVARRLPQGAAEVHDGRWGPWQPAHGLGADVAGAVLGSIVAALALLAAITGFCTGCEAYKLGCRLSGRPFVSCPIPGARA